MRNKLKFKNTTKSDYKQLQEAIVSESHTTFISKNLINQLTKANEHFKNNDTLTVTRFNGERLEKVTYTETEYFHYLLNEAIKFTK